MRKFVPIFTSTLVLFSSFGVAAVNAGTPTITLVTTFDYPLATSGTSPAEINDRGDIAGFFSTTTRTNGFVRLNDGSFTKPIDGPNHAWLFAYGINSSRTVCGLFTDPQNNAIGFFLTGRTLTQYSFPGASQTGLFSLNDNGAFAGYVLASQGYQAFASIGGIASVINIPGSIDSEAYAINNTNEIAGTYESQDSHSHGFLLNADGSLTAPIDYPGASGTRVFGLSDKGVIAGFYYNSDFIPHAFLLKPPGAFVSYDYPGATWTEFNGINANGQISGRYAGSDSIFHGFIAQITKVP
jgi:hypothetical protein